MNADYPIPRRDTRWAPRPTTYRGVKMRSRTEAAWAQQLDAWGFKWEYEPQCFAGREGQYLPDFRVDISTSNPWHPVAPRVAPVYFEVKPSSWADEEDAQRWLRILHESEPHAGLVVAQAGEDKTGFLSAFVGDFPDDYVEHPMDSGVGRCVACGRFELAVSCDPPSECCEARLDFAVPAVAPLYVTGWFWDTMTKSLRELRQRASA